MNLNVSKVKKKERNKKKTTTTKRGLAAVWYINRTLHMVWHYYLRGLAESKVQTSLTVRNNIHIIQVLLKGMDWY